MNDWQAPVALVIVAATCVIFVLRFFRLRGSKKRGGCGDSCGCGGNAKIPTLKTKKPNS